MLIDGFSSTMVNGRHGETGPILGYYAALATESYLDVYKTSVPEIGDLVFIVPVFGYTTSDTLYPPPKI